MITGIDGVTDLRIDEFGPRIPIRDSVNIRPVEIRHSVKIRDSVDIRHSVNPSIRQFHG